MDACLLIDLVMRSSDISDDIAKSAKESISLRLLEKLFVKKNQNRDDKTSEMRPKIRFDPSLSCEDVLKQILQEIPDMLKWDVQSFVMHKRSCLPKYALPQRKVKFAEDSYPRVAPVKERSRMSSGNWSKNVVSADTETDEQIVGKPLAPIENLSTRDQYATDIFIDGTKETRKEDAHCPVCPFTLNENLFSSTQSKESLPAKRSKPASLAYLQGGKCPTEQTMAKKHKQEEEVCQRWNDDFDTIGKRIAQLIGGEECSLVKDSTARCSVPSKPPIVNDSHTILTKLEQSCDIRHAFQLHRSNIEVPQGTNAKEDIQNVCNHDVSRFKRGLMKTEDLSNGGPTHEAGNKVEHTPEPESCSDIDDCQEEIIEIATRKIAFLSSQCTCSQDSFTTTDSKELNHCLKCNKDGKLLVCSSGTCPVVVHDNCLGSVPVLDKAGKFYCPLCACSRAISEYLDLKKMASDARCDLKSFCLGIEQSSKYVPTRSVRLRQSQTLQKEELSANDVTSSTRSSSKPANGSIYVASTMF